MNGPPHQGRNVIIVMVLLLAMLLPIAIAVSYFQDAPTTSIGSVQIQTATQSVNPGLATDTPRPARATKTVRNAEPAQGNNCTYPANHWLVSTENWPAEITIGNLYYTQEQAIEFVTAQPSGAFNVLFIQLHAAYLNVLSGASQSQIVEPMIEASDWLNKVLYGSDIAVHGHERGLELAKVIQAYNDGEIGPGRCAAYSLPLGLFSNKISAAVLSLTPDVTIEAAQTNVPTLRTPTTVIRTPASSLPTTFSPATRTPTRRPDIKPSVIPPTLAPTLAPTAQPSATQVPPTARPTSPPTPRPTSPPPTDTPRPAEPTPTSAPPEEPTPTSPP